MKSTNYKIVQASALPRQFLLSLGFVVTFNVSFKGDNCETF
jgi:hypothetical protein